MPVIKSAKKKLKQDKKRTLANKKLKDLMKMAVKTAGKKSSEENISKAFRAIDKAAKANVIHKNKAARMKSALSKTSLVKTAKVATPAKKKKLKKTTKKAS